MKLIRFGAFGAEKPGLQLEDGSRIDVSSIVEDYTPEFFAEGGLEKLAAADLSSCPAVAADVRLGAILKRPGKMVCIGLNFKDHAEEGGMAVPAEPVVFYKATSAIVGPNDDIVIPKGSEKTDWEVELAVVIGKRASYVSEADALDYVAGYALHNDYSERAYQLEKSGQWMLGKGCDTFAPLGPFMATADEIANPNSLKMWLKVNGVQKQNGTTENFIFNTQHVISYLSQYMTLEPGDIISTGTPAGVGLGFNPAQYIQPGDVIELGIEGLGESAQTAKAYQG
ncbi:ATP/GTP-binding site motif A (P-loop):Fumarylacetoacetate (FAA) hydrolase [Lentisphaera araneosa HTCC2155]|uniref:ATP/GTP-binding site motif A (P-loop):Fumarylacetoacetate (FAA) hydrolase n=1 Tax=Lentisphaera araneosa HTCC2155 TaxID=313628 RepID=A6DG04_9BACT|nr:fumarylacetoacetate hydrolase family protein [Lentisphaera araneosa]EDM29734.1 ATP/GTP-binding site motif A (P-loop):Fumarylacetoacetate (FAA) hydrolase [Lentisphaera araneosa HTCC2155]